MEENKSNKGLICLIVILIILILGLVGYIVYDKVLKVDKVIPNYACHYIIGNPPFSGLSALPAKNKKLKKQQTEDMNRVFKDLPKHGKLDYVTAWYEKAADMMQGTNIKASFVSTNSITQGEQVGILWKHLIEDKNLTIIFAYRSFVWNNEAKDTAKVHCVIVGFTCGKYKGEKTLFEGEKVKNVLNLKALTSNIIHQT